MIRSTNRQCAAMAARGWYAVHMPMRPHLRLRLIWPAVGPSSNCSAPDSFPPNGLALPSIDVGISFASFRRFDGLTTLNNKFKNQTFGTFLDQINTIAVGRQSAE